MVNINICRFCCRCCWGYFSVGTTKELQQKINGAWLPPTPTVFICCCWEMKTVGPKDVKGAPTNEWKGQTKTNTFELLGVQKWCIPAPFSAQIHDWPNPNPIQIQIQSKSKYSIWQKAVLNTKFANLDQAVQAWSCGCTVRRGQNQPNFFSTANFYGKYFQSLEHDLGVIRDTLLSTFPLYNDL